MSRRPNDSVPFDDGAEVSVLGSILLNGEAMHRASRDLLPEDFYAPRHQHIFAACVAAHRSGPVDAVTVADELRRAGLLDEVGGSITLLELINATPSISNFGRYSQIVQDLAARRRVISATAAISAMALDPTAAYDAAEVIDRAKRMLAGIAPARVAAPKDLITVEAFLDRQRDPLNRNREVIPGILRERHRVIFVAPEGIGKGVLLRQLALACSQGIHPFDPRFAIDPTRTVYFDLENPEEVIEHHIDLARPTIEAVRSRFREDDGTPSPTWLPNQAWMLPRESGMNIRDRAVQAEFEAVIAQVRPGLVVLGPVYKAVRKRPTEDHASSVLEAIEFLDDLRVRYGFALALEAHASKGTGGHRDMDPAGASEWMRWPEFGLSLIPAGSKETGGKGNVLKVQKFRGNRLPAAWPDFLHRRFSSTLGATFPWSGHWDDGRDSPAGLARLHLDGSTPPDTEPGPF